MGPTAQRERVEQKRGELEELRIDCDLRQQREKERQEKAERRVAAAAERQAQAEERARAQRQRQQIRLEEARQAEAREQAARETEARHRRRQWEADWLDHALNLVPSDVPHNFELDVHQAVAELLPRLDSCQPEHLTRRLIQAAIDKVLQPWHRNKEIEKIIEEARNQLPIHARSWSSTPNEWEARVMRAAADALARLGKDAPLSEIRAAMVETSKKVCVECEASKVAEDHRSVCENIVRSIVDGEDAREAVRQALEELPVGATRAKMESARDAVLVPFRAAKKAAADAEDHRRACEDIVRWVFDGEDAREAVRQALEKLPVGATRAKMENARDAALAPFRAAKKAAADADRHLLHVHGYIHQLGDEDNGEWELGEWSERYELAKRLTIKLRPILTRWLTDEPLDDSQARRRIEKWIVRELESED